MIVNPVYEYVPSNEPLNVVQASHCVVGATLFTNDWLYTTEVCPVPVTVYVVVTVGLAIGDAQVVQESPVDGDQEYATPPVAVNGAFPPTQIVTSEPPLIIGSGLTVILKLDEDPAQEEVDGVTVTVDVTATLVLFVAVNERSPVPVVASPMLPSLLVQVYVVPPTLPVNGTETVLPLHAIWSDTASTFGVGFTVVVFEALLTLVQPFISL